MSEQTFISLEEIASNEPGSIAIGPFGSRMKSDLYVDAGVPVIRGTNISKGQWLEGNWVYVPESFAQTLPNCLLKPGDLVFPHRGSIGEVAIIKSEHCPMLLSSSMMKFRPDSSKADSLFLFYYFRSHIGRTEIMKFSSQVGTPGIGQPLTSLRQFKVPNIPIEEQKAIAHILGSLDDKIELNLRMNETLEVMAQSLFKSWFVDFDPVFDNALAAGNEIPEEFKERAEIREALGDERRTLPEEIQKLFPDEFGYTEDIGWIPKGWNVAKIGSLVELVYGKSLSKSVREPGPYPVYGSGGVGGYHNEALVSGPGIIVGRKGTVGSVYWEEKDFFPIDTVFYVKTLIGTPLYWIYQSLFRMDIASLGADSAVPGVNRNAVYAQKWICSPENIFVQYEDWIATILEEMSMLRNQSETLNNLRSTLLSKLLSGELRIPDAAILLEETEISGGRNGKS